MLDVACILYCLKGPALFQPLLSTARGYALYGKTSDFSLEDEIFNRHRRIDLLKGNI